jgi:hypothetical protein
MYPQHNNKKEDSKKKKNLKKQISKSSGWVMEEFTEKVIVDNI